MARALELAEQGRYTVSPNPMVGCVIVRGGEVIAEGWHRRAGEGHAEIDALQHCDDPRGATLFVTLEPCSHHGRTPPCVEAVLAAGLARVVIAMTDPNPLVDGRGLAALRSAGIEVTVGIREGEARRLNEKFLWAISQKLPFVLVKAAMTLDGKLATVARESQWLTAEAAREQSLLLREEYDAIVVGSGTVKADDPRLTRRLGLAGDTTSWTRVVLNGAGDLPAHSRLLTDGGTTLVYSNRLDLELVFAELHARGVQSCIVEGGSTVHSEVIRRGLWQKMILFVAPMLIGGAEAPSIFSGEAVSRLTDAYRFRFDRVELVGRDLMITAYPA